MMHSRFLLASFIAVLLLVGASPAFAQLQSSELGISISPERPGPNQSVNISITSFSANLASADILWTIDGKTVLKGIGKTDLLFTTKGIGDGTQVGVTVTPTSGFPLSQTVTVMPVGGDLLWQAIDSIVPPFYRGKALPGSESQIRFVAMPELKTSGGTLVPAQQLLYTWKPNYVRSSSGSGYGKNSFIMQTNYLNRVEEMLVEVDTRDGTIGSDASVTIATVEPKILWYAQSPLYGPMFDRALENGHSVTGNVMTVVAMPFFFSPKNPSSSQLTYEWRLNNQKISASDTPNVLSLQRQNNDSGEALINLSVHSAVKLFQEARSTLSLSLE